MYICVSLISSTAFVHCIPINDILQQYFQIVKISVHMVHELAMSRAL